jgi:beta-galactosidase
VCAAAALIAKTGPQAQVSAPVALVFSYEAAWVTGIQPQGQSFRYLELVYEWYSALRQRGLDVDIVAPGADLSGYKAVLVPTLPILPEGFAARLAALDCPVLVGPRTGSKTASFCIPEGLAPGALRSRIPVTVSCVESLRDGIAMDGKGFAVTRWFEHIETSLEPEFALEDGRGVVFRNSALRYCAGWPDAELLGILIEHMAGEAGIALIDLPEGVRMRRTSTHSFTFNYHAEAVWVEAIGEVLEPAGWHIESL